jgi:hypothetical protein
MDTSEETSDTCVDDHHENTSSGPPSGALEYYHGAHQGGHQGAHQGATFMAVAGMTPKTRRTHISPSKSPSWKRPPQASARQSSKEKTLEHTRAARSRDSGINDQRESLSLSCSCNNDTSW